jgi:hypothetical protein
MGVMAVSTEEIGSLAGAREVPCPFPMDACPPISVLRPMAFATKPIALREVYEFPIKKS